MECDIECYNFFDVFIIDDGCKNKQMTQLEME